MRERRNKQGWSKKINVRYKWERNEPDCFSNE